MHYVHVTAGVVDNRAVFDQPMPEDWPDYENWHLDEEAQIGWTYADGTFTAPPPESQPEPPPAAPPPGTPTLYDHENRLRSLEGLPPMTLEDLLTKMRPP